MNMNFLRKLPTPQEIKNLYPLSEELELLKKQNDEEIIYTHNIAFIHNVSFCARKYRLDKV